MLAFGDKSSYLFSVSNKWIHFPQPNLKKKGSFCTFVSLIVILLESPEDFLQILNSEWKERIFNIILRKVASKYDFKEKKKWTNEKVYY